jgi:hypothetical protein
MAKINCALEPDGRLRVLRVIEFQPGDTIELEQAVEVLWQFPNIPGPVTAASKCLVVKNRFSPDHTIIQKSSHDQTIVQNVIPTPCPGN